MASMFEEDDYFIPPLRKDSTAFPDPRLAPDEGLLAYGGDLSSDRLIAAYKKGIFPWYSQGDPILWWSPNPRLLLYPEKFKIRKSFRRVLRSGKFTVTFDQRFSDVIKHCATVYREGQESTWIVSEIKEAYIRLYEEGVAHSVEVYKEGKLVGGLYGIALGKAFFGESMFSLVSDASKVAFKALSDVLGSRGYDFIDCQMKTDHMIGLGAEVVERDIFLDALEKTLEKPTDFGSWQHFSWEYKDGE
ncbi:leucyl/phenylalanyl-tRNA--protein transferase [Sulfurovum sp. TSL1]|uniref:leucyl/phenylalanyl-tRNA--protein transferase n=1 Tax=Sulfurovum sp. TSL1 TaxID=2826994 RepID=UPI001CC69E40|nr:leucyl/phenylalanyl-tRNA--protein transferase [Sulfurovum sp. TSL1]GIT98582.1 leucyl/phenylalanyl-tRNA--protein transferase [Sulfurovum sp. TSL1]